VTIDDSLPLVAADTTPALRATHKRRIGRGVLRSLLLVSLPARSRKTSTGRHRRIRGEQ